MTAARALAVHRAYQALDRALVRLRQRNTVRRRSDARRALAVLKVVDGIAWGIVFPDLLEIDGDGHLWTMGTQDRVRAEIERGSVAA